MSAEQSLPTSWIECTLGDVVNYGATQKAEPSEIPNDAWVLELEDIERDSSKVLQRLSFAERQSKSTKSRFSQGDVLYGKLRPYLNKVIRADAAGYCTTEIVPLTPPEGLNSGYLFHWLKNPRFLEHVTSVSHGLSMPRLGTNAGRAAPFVLAPFPEQKRISEKLDALLARVGACREHLERVSGTLKRFRQSVLAAATTGELTRGWRTRNAVGEAGFEQRITIGSVCAESFYGPRFGKREYTTEGIPTIRTTDMTRDGRIEITDDTPRVMIPKAKLGQFAVRRGDLLVTRTGSIGVMAVFDGDYRAVPSAYLIRFRFSDVVLPRFMFFCLMAPEGQERLGLSATAITQPNINAEAIKRIKIPLPSLAEQEEVIRRANELFSFADGVEERLRAGAEFVARLVPAALAKAFRGELVPQDPNDEPAEKLLATIKVERSTPVIGGRPGRTTTKRKQTDMSVRGKDVIKAAILTMKSKTFSFDDLRGQVPGDYESLKAAVFELLEAPEPIIRQVFNKKVEAIQFERVTS